MASRRPSTRSSSKHHAHKVWIPELVERIAAFLPPNEIPLTLRLLNKASAALFCKPQHLTVRTSLSLPRHTYRRGLPASGLFRRATLNQRRRLVCLAAAGGSMPELEAALEATECGLTSAVMEAAAAACQLTMCQRLAARGCTIAREALFAAAKAGHQSVCAWLLSSGRITWDAEAVYAAARGGHVGLVEWLAAKRPAQLRPMQSGVSVTTLLAAAAHGCDLVGLQRLHAVWAEREQRPGEWDRKHILSAAAGSPTPCWQQKVVWLLGVYGDDTLESVPSGAAACPDAVARLQWFAQHFGPGGPLGAGAGGGDDHLPLAANRALHNPADLLAPTASRGDVEALQFIFSDLGVRISEIRTFDTLQSGDMIITAAAEGGHIAALQLLHDQGVRTMEKRTPGIAYAAAACGHVTVLEWILDTGLPAWLAATREIWPGDNVSIDNKRKRYVAKVIDKVVAAGVSKGRSAVVRFGLERGGRLPQNAWVWAAEAGSEELLELLAEEGCPMQDSQPYVSAARNGDLRTLSVLRRLGCGWDPDGWTFVNTLHCDDARLPVLRWFLDEGCPVDWSEAESAAQMRERDAAEVGAWLQQKRRRWRQQ